MRISILPWDISLAAKVVLIVLLLLLSGTFSGLNLGLMSLTVEQLEMYIRSGTFRQTVCCTSVQTVCYTSVQTVCYTSISQCRTFISKNTFMCVVIVVGGGGGFDGFLPC